MARHDQDMPAVGFSDRMLAEAVRALEEDGRAPIDDRAADERAIDAGGAFEQRLIVRAGALAISGRLTNALAHTRRFIGLVLIGGVVLAAVAGASAARASLAVRGDEPVNIFWALGGFLGFQTLLLAVWLVLIVWSPAALPGASLGGAVLALGRRLAGRLHKAAPDTAAVEAVGAVWARGSIGRWTLSAMSHTLWVAFNAACLLLVILLLSVRHYTFTWETTILSAGTYERLTGVIAALPRLAGFPTPTAAQIAEAQWPPDPAGAEEARQEWSGLLTGSVVCYGLAPRLVLLVVCLGLSAAARRRFRLDTKRPGYLRLEPRLIPQTASLGIVDPDTGEPEAPAATQAAPVGGTGDPVLLGIEIEPPESPWPPQLGGTGFNDLGFVDSRDDRQRVLGQLAALANPPSVAVAVCALTTTPDRGIASFLGQVQEAVRAPLALVLTGGDALRRRGNHDLVADRVNDWRQLAAAVGVAPPRVVEIDLDHVTETSLGSLASVLGTSRAESRGVVGASRAASSGGRRIEPAFDLIVEHLGRWPGAPDARQQAKLHEAIGALHRSELPAWKSLLRVPDRLEGDLAAPLRAGAERVVGLLPTRLRLRPRWIASGAVAGALGCVAASTFLFPAAIAALPVWTAIGAAVAGVAGTAGKGAEATENDGPADVQRSDAVRAAALFALVLDLQGRDEASITRILDDVIGDDGEGEFSTPVEARAWLDGLRHRLDLALAAAETAS